MPENEPRSLGAHELCPLPHLTQCLRVAYEEILEVLQAPQVTFAGRGAQLVTLEGVVLELRRHHVAQQCGVCIGGVITYEGTDYRVGGITPQAVVAYARRKDGEFSERHRFLTPDVFRK